MSNYQPDSNPQLIKRTEKRLKVLERRANPGGRLSEIEERLLYGYLPAGSVRFTASGTFSKATYPWLRAIRVRVQGAGGAGGGAAATGANYSAGTGGGGGGYAESWIIDIAGLVAGVTVTIGAGGTGVSGSTGNAGGSSSFGSAVAANGGGGGGTKPASIFAPYIASPAGGSGTAGDLLITGQGGDPGAGYSDLGSGGQGGSSQLGGGAPSQGSGSGGVVGAAGGNYGGGGGGAFNTTSQSARVGGAGAPGIVIVELFA